MKKAKHDDICPRCGFPLPLRQQSERCPNCQYRLLGPDDPVCHLTIFGCGVCGLVAGAFTGATWSLTLPSGHVQRSMMVLMPLAFGVVGAVITTWIRRHIAPEFRAGLEQLLLAVAVGAAASTFAALCGLSSSGVLATVGILVTAAVRAWITPRLTEDLEKQRVERSQTE